MHAELTQLPDHRGRCSVQAGLLKIDVELSALRRARGGAVAPAKSTMTKRQKQKNKNVKGQRGRLKPLNHRRGVMLSLRQATIPVM